MPAFSFSHISASDDGSTLSGRCIPGADMPMFAGHFAELPIMPAVAQIAMLQALIRQHSDWGTTITGGSRLKFSGLIQPGDKLTLTLHRNAECVRFNIDTPAGPAAKGTLTLSSERDD